VAAVPTAHSDAGNADACERLYQLFTQESDDRLFWRDETYDGGNLLAELERWLMLHSNYFRNELIESASSITDKYGDKDLPKALAKLDWKMAGPLLESMASASQPDSIQTALSLLYEHALEKNDVMQIENYRGRLKEIVTDPPESSLWRGIALGSLMATEWRGQEEWFLSLFNDPVLAGLIENPLNHSDTITMVLL
jgi:hypothetical protein